MSGLPEARAMSETACPWGEEARTEGASGTEAVKEQEERGSSSQTSGSVASSVPTSPAFWASQSHSHALFAQLKME